jgi:hypothetical protein
MKKKMMMMMTMKEPRWPEVWPVATPAKRSLQTAS